VAEEFNPADHLRTLGNRGGAQYIDVKWRVLWFRDQHPEGEIVTELLEHERGQYALFKATVRFIVDDPNNEELSLFTVVTGHGSETKADFPDYLEKAETKAIGRALQHAGYGTAALEDDGNRVVDAPVERRPSAAAAAQRPVVVEPSEITEAQKNAISNLARQIGWNERRLKRYVAEQYDGLLLESLSFREAGAVIQHLQREKSEGSRVEWNPGDLATLPPREALTP